MSPIRRVVFLALAMMAASPAPVWAEDPAARRLVGRWLKRAGEKEAQASVPYECARTELLLWFARDGAIHRREFKEFIVRDDSGGPVSRLVRVDGRPARPAEIRREQEREGGRREKAGQYAKARKEETEWVNEKLAAHYDFFQEGVTNIAGRSTVILRFEPKADGPKEDGAEERVLGRLRGRVWLDEADLEPVRVEARLVQPISFAYGMLAKLDRLELELTQERKAEALWVPMALNVDIEGRRLWSSFHVRDQMKQTSIVVLEAGRK